MEHEKEMKDLTKEDITSPGFIESIFTNYVGEERNNIILDVVDVANKCGVMGKVKNAIANCRKDPRFQSNSFLDKLTYDERGISLKPTIGNYEEILRNDEWLKILFYKDIFGNKIIRCDGRKAKLWVDDDDSEVLGYISTKYGLFNEDMFRHAFRNICNERKTHPIKQILEESPWDGLPRIDKFLTRIMKCEDSDYAREVSRMIFYGGISRVYEPGCKFDYMPILIGKQGTGKSTIVRWLALRNTFFTPLSSIDGKDGYEIIQGRWICEMGELSAMVKAREVESLKAFISETIDKYRPAYNRYTIEQPRTCIFIGTTNDHQFLSDQTGNRRYLPIEIGLEPGELHDNEDYIKSYILQCWREALYLYHNKKTYLTIPKEYYDEVTYRQESVMQDDPQQGMIIDYLMTKNVGDRVCSQEILINVFGRLKKDTYNSVESRKIGRILNSMGSWQYGGNNRHNFGESFGRQRYWEKIDLTVKSTDDDDPDWSDLD